MINLINKTVYLQVTGGRDYTDVSVINKVLDYVKKSLTDSKIVLIEGGARGVDSLCKEWAIKNNIEVQTVEAQWRKYGNSAGFLRNQEMIDICKDYMLQEHKVLGIVFPGGNGTRHMHTLMKKNDFNFIIVGKDASIKIGE